MRQVRALLARGTYPLVVTEGTDREKAGRVAASPYLLHCHRRLAAAEGDLFAHGFSFSANDAHITDRVADPACRVSTLYVGLHVDPDGDDDADAVRRRAGRLRRARAHAGGVPLDVRCYDTATAAVWR